MYKSKRGWRSFRRIIKTSFMMLLFCNFLIYTNVNSLTNLVTNSKNTNFVPQTDNSPSVKNTIAPVEQVNQLNNFYDNSCVNVYYYGEPYDSLILFTMEKRSFITGKGVSTMVAISDLNGTIIAYKEIDSNFLISLGESLTSCSAEMINSTTVLYGDPYATLWNFETGVTVKLGFYGHHELEYVSTRDTIFVLEQREREIDGKLFMTDLINEYDLNSNLIWSLDTYDIIGIQNYCPFIDYEGQYKIDVTHGNTIFYDEEEDIIYYNSRNLNTFYKIDYSTKNIIWSLGEYGDFTLYNKHGIIMDNLFYHAHSIERIADNTFILFDNDRHNQTDSYSRTSRIVELVIDDVNLVANESFTWEAPRSYWSGYWGNADLLPNGNFFGVFGTPSHAESEIGARLVEVNREGELIWELNYDWVSQYYSYGIYRAQRFNYKPTIFESEDVLLTPKDDVEVSWKVAYNFKTESDIQGTYTIYLNNSVVQSGFHVFDKFWKPSYLNTNLGKLSAGYYNLTLVLSDNEGHISTSEVSISIQNFLIKRNGPTRIELGQINSNITWAGVTISPLSFNITIDGFLRLADSWIGENIILDLNSLSIGVHLVEFQIFNQSLSVFNDNFNVSIYPLEAPYFYLIAEDIDLEWNKTSILSWSIYDALPNYVEIYLDNDILTTFKWENTTQAFEIETPLLDEGYYEIKFKAFDQNMLVNESVSFLHIYSPAVPIFVETPQNTLYWGIPAILRWEIHGGSAFYLYRNDSLIFEQLFYSKYIRVNIQDWWTTNWFPGIYNVTLFIEDAGGHSIVYEQWISVLLEFGDPYGDDFLQDDSFFYFNGQASVGPADNEYTTITSSYSNGFITLDMGEGEEILNLDGDDFWIIATGGVYNVRVSNDPSVFFDFLESGVGNESFDLGNIRFNKARYIQIVYSSGANIQVDAIEAIHYRILTEEDDPPEIVPLEDLSVGENNSFVELIWEVHDATPWNYSIYVDNSLVFSYPWRNDPEIIYPYEISHEGTVNVTLVLFDLFGNSIEDTVLIDVLAISSEKTSFSLIFACSVMVVSQVIKTLKKRKSMSIAT